MSTSRKLALASIFMAVIGFTACQKESLSPNNDELSLAKDNASMDNEADMAGSVINAIAMTNNLGSIGAKTDGNGQVFGNITLPACATVTVDTIGNPHSITVDFGSTPCQCDQWDGLYRQGVVKATWTGAYKDPGTVITITTTNYYRGVSADEMDAYNINRTVTNTGYNENNNLTFHIVNVVSVNYYDGTTSNWTGDHVREWTAGENTLDLNDDVFEITGSGNGTSRMGIPVTHTITTAITKDACDWYPSGVIQIVRNNQPAITLDFGNGNCDNLATVTVNGYSKTIILN